MSELPHILIVDDEPFGRETLGEMLMTQGYELMFAANGAEAFAQLEAGSPDLILLDVMMPGLDGFEVCQRLKSDGRWRHVPIILVTALDSKSDLARGLDAGADDFLHKPVNSLELRARVRSMLRIKKQYDELQETLTLRDDMANMIIHDMRIPLTAILGLSELPQIEAITLEQLKEDVEIIHSNARRLNAFINDMLTLAKMKSGKLILNRSPVNLRRQVKLVKQSHSVSAEIRQINLVVDLTRLAADQVNLDEPLFQRVFDNLISNAIKFSPPESTITLKLEYPADDVISDAPWPHLRVSIIDEGVGIGQRYRHKVFDKFNTVDSHPQDIPQLGLGLAFCKMVVEAHGGRIFAEANHPRGSIFIVEI